MADAVTGLTSYANLDEQPHARITWIAWDSPFRATDLRIGDRIVAVNGQCVTAEQLAKDSSNLPGFYAEATAFARAGLVPGSPLTLLLHRRALPNGWTEVGVTAPLATATAPVRTPDGRSLVAPGGPDIYDSAGFNNGGWAGWYAAFVTLLTTLADADRRHGGSFNTRTEYRSLGEQHGARVDFAVANFPCDWSRVLKADYDSARAAMAGAPASLAAGALDFRRRGEVLAAEIRALATAAWDAAIAARPVVPAAPAPDPAADDVSALAGQMVVLPPLGNSQYLSDGGRNWFAAGAAGDGWWFLDAEAPAAIAMLRAQRRYTRLVDPDLRAEWRFLGRITTDVRLCAIGSRAYFGLVVEPVAALVGNAMFVDLATIEQGEVRFAGEDGLFDDTPDLPPDDADPAAVVAAVVAAVKAGDLALWSALHAGWFTEYRADDAGAMHPVLTPIGRKPSPDRFEDQRRLMQERCCDARPFWTGDPVVLIPAGRYEGAPAIEAVTVWVDHIGDFSVDSGLPPGSDYRSYIDVMVRQTWVLQRIGTGPWRIDDAGKDLTMASWDGRTKALDGLMANRPFYPEATIAAVKGLYSARADILDGIAALATDPGNESKTREINDRIGALVDRWVLPFGRLRSNVTPYSPIDKWIEAETANEMGFFQGLNNLGIGEARDQLIALEKGLEKLVSDLQLKWDAMTYGAKELERIETEANQKMNDIVQNCIRDATDAWLRVTAAANVIIAKFYKFPDHVNDAIVAAAKAAGIPDQIAELIPKVSLLGKDYFAAGKDLGIPAAQLAKANPELFRDPGMAVSETIQGLFGPDFEILITALVNYHKCVAPLIDGAYYGQLNNVQSKVPNRGAILVSFTETRRDVDKFLDENGLDKARTIFENFDASLRMWPERVNCDGLYDDAKAMAALVSESFKRRFERMTNIFGVFVQANQGRFTGSVDKRTENELIFTDIWQDRERGVLARGMDQRLKAWRGDVMKIDDIWESANSQLRVAMRAVPADLERSIDYALNRYLESLRARVKRETEAAARTLESAVDVVSDEKTARTISRAPMQAMLR